MPTIEQKFATFMSLLTPEEQRAVAPLMQTFAGALGTSGGEPGENTPSPIPPPSTEPMIKPPAQAPASAIPGGPPLPPPGPDPTMSIGRQVY